MTQIWAAAHCFKSDQCKKNHLELGSQSFTILEQVVSGYFATVNFYICLLLQKNIQFSSC